MPRYQDSVNIYSTCITAPQRCSDQQSIGQNIEYCIYTLVSLLSTLFTLSLLFSSLHSVSLNGWFWRDISLRCGASPSNSHLHNHWLLICHIHIMNKTFHSPQSTFIAMATNWLYADNNEWKIKLENVINFFFNNLYLNFSVKMTHCKKGCHLF